MARINAYPSSSTINASDTVIGTNSQNLRTENYTIAQIGQVALGYIAYAAILSQSSTDDPVATVLKNDTGATYTWTRTNIGVYEITNSDGLFNKDTTLVFGNIGAQVKPFYFRWRVVNANVIEVTTYDETGTAADKVFNKGSFEIRIYS